MATPDFTRRALADLDAIWDYTMQEWGEAQAETYVEGIYRACEAIAEGVATVRPFPMARKVTGYCRFEHHYIFFVKRGVATTVIAVLHERMDLIARVRERL